MTRESSARTAVAGLAAVPPEIAAARLALLRADARPRWAPWRRWVNARHLGEALGSVDYLRGELSRVRSSRRGAEVAG